MTAGVPESMRISAPGINLESLNNEPVRLNDVESIEIGPCRLTIRLRNGRKLIVEPDVFDEIRMCRSESPLWFVDCVLENLKLRWWIEDDGSSGGSR